MSKNAFSAAFSKIKDKNDKLKTKSIILFTIEKRKELARGIQKKKKRIV